MICGCPYCNEQRRLSEPPCLYERLVNAVGIKNLIRATCFIGGVFGAVIINSLLSII